MSAFKFYGQLMKQVTYLVQEYHHLKKFFYENGEIALAEPPGPDINHNRGLMKYL